MTKNWQKKSLELLKTSTFYERFVVFSIFLLLPLAISPMTRDIYTIIKWKMVHFLALFAIVQLCFVQRSLFLPKINTLFRTVFLGILAVWGFEYYFHNIPFASEVTTDRFGFIILTLFFLYLFKKDSEVITIIGYALILSMLCFTALLFFKGTLQVSELFQSIPVHKKLSYSFGNENMAAQFFGLAIIATLRNTFIQKNRWMKGISCLLFILFTFLLIKTECRSILIGIGLGCSFYAVMQLDHYRKRVLIGSIFIGLIAIPLLIFMRPRTTNHRLDMWQNAVTIAKDYPLGIGRGKFGFYHTLYQQEDQVHPRMEGLIERTPHNEFFKYLAEEGWLYVCLVFLLIGSFLYAARHSLLKSFQSNEKTQIMGAFTLLLFVEACLQFPFELALPYLMLSIVAGYFLSLVQNQKKISVPFWAALPLFIVFLTISIFLWLSDLAYGAKRTDSAFVARACTYSPYAWRTCEIHLMYLLQQKKTPEAIDLALTHLELRPYNFLTLYRLGQAYMESGEKGLACKLAWFHDRLFYHKSKLRKFVLNQCPESEQEMLLSLPLKDHYRSLFNHLPQTVQTRLHHNT